MVEEVVEVHKAWFYLPGCFPEKHPVVREVDLLIFGRRVNTVLSIHSHYACLKWQTSRLNTHIPKKLLCSTDMRAEVHALDW